MKIRKGFVSNSSSSSFLMVGMKMDVPDDLPDFLAKLEGMTEEELLRRARAYKHYTGDEKMSDQEFYDYCADCIFDFTYKQDGFDIFVGEDFEYFILGREIASTYNQEVKAIDVESLAGDESEKFENALERLGLDIDECQIFLGGF